MICNVCLNALNANGNTKSRKALTVPFSGGLVRRHHETIDSLMRSVDASCYICATFHEQSGIKRLDLQPNPPSQHARKEESFTMIKIHASSPAESILLIIDCSTPDVQEAWFHCYLEHGNSPYVRLPDLEGPNRVDAQLQLAKIWLDECTKDHVGKCLQTKKASGEKGTPYIPSRLLQLKSAANNISQGSWRVLITSEAKQDGGYKYATVSHRWKPGDQAKLSKENLVPFQSYQPDSLLSTDVQKAMTVARSLGIHFLWLDTHCILQDSEDDWSYESMQMHEMYRNSLCNIVVEPPSSELSHSPGHTKGNLTPRETIRPELKWTWAMFSPQKIKEDYQNGNYLNIFKKGFRRTDGRTFIVTETGFWTKNLFQREMATRAWIFQELMLSPRILHVYEDQLFWECETLKACEWFSLRDVDGSLSSWGTRYDFRSLLFGSETSSAAGTVDQQNRHLEAWEELVKKYSSCKLSFPKDKLVGIAGVAKSLAEVYPDDYFAGLFRRSLPRGLLWRRSYWNYLSRATVYRAPSWSWASVDGEVDFVGPYHREDTPVATVEEVSTQPTGQDTFGEVTSGHIVLQGPLLDVMFVREAEIPHVVNVALPRLILPGKHFEIHWFVDVETEDSGEGKLFLPLLYRKTANTVSGLLLAPTTDSTGDQSTFTRVGLLEIELKNAERVENHLRVVSPPSQVSWDQKSPILQHSSWLALEKQRITIH